MNSNNKIFQISLYLTVFLFILALVFLSCEFPGGGGDNNTNGDGEGNNTISDSDIAEAFDFPVEDRRQVLLSTLGPPDTFLKIAEEVEGHSIITEEWSYIELGVRVDMIDGDIVYVIPIDTVEHDVAVYPRFYDPTEFDLPMDNSTVIKILDGQDLSELDLAEAAIEGGTMVIGDQIMLGFSGDQLVYVETYALIPDPEGEMENLFIDDIQSENLRVDSKNDGNENAKSQVQPGIQTRLAPVQLIVGFFRIFRAHSQRNKAYREINKALQEYKEYLERLNETANKLALDCQLNPRTSRQSTVETWIKMKIRLMEELEAVTALSEEEKKAARIRFINTVRRELINALVSSGAAQKIITKLGVGKIKDSLSELQSLAEGSFDPGNLQNFETKLTDRMSRLGVFGRTIGGVVGARLNRVIAKIQRSFPGVKQIQGEAQKLQSLLTEAQGYIEQVENAVSSANRPYSPAMLLGTVEDLFNVLDDSEADALSAALAKEMEPGFAKNMLIADARLDPKQLGTVRERLRGAILKKQVKAIVKKAADACNRPAGSKFRNLLEEDSQNKLVMPGHGLGSESALEADCEVQFGPDDYPINVCDNFPINFEILNDEIQMDLENETYIEVPDEGCRLDNDRDGHPSKNANGDDCDDFNPRRFPGNPEVCDEIDNDCDAEVDEGLNGACTEKCENDCIDDDGDGLADCDDSDCDFHPACDSGCGISCSSSDEDQQELLWVLVATEANPNGEPTEFAGGPDGYPDCWYCDARYEGKTRSFTITENSISMHDVEMDHGEEYHNVTLTSTFETPTTLIPDEYFTLSVNFSHSGTVSMGGGTGLTFIYLKDGYWDGNGYCYTPWNTNCSDNSSTTFDIYIPFAIDPSFDEKDEFTLGVGWLNCGACSVVWHYEAQYQ